MLKYLAKRIGRSILTLFIIVTLVFCLLRLMPVEPLAMNMSNTLRNMPGMVSATAARAVRSRRAGFLDFPPVRKVMLGLYDAIFRWYYDRD